MTFMGYSVSRFHVFSLLDGVSLQNNFKYLLDSYQSREDNSVSFSDLVPPEPDLVHQHFPAARISQNFLLLWFRVECFNQLFVSFHQLVNYSTRHRHLQHMESLYHLEPEVICYNAYLLILQIYLLLYLAKIW